MLFEEEYEETAAAPHSYGRGQRRGRFPGTELRRDARRAWRLGGNA